MRISEIFYSIQGEGVHQGVPMVFVRFQGCNLIPHCSWCDTPYAQNAEVGGKDKSVIDVVDEVMRLSPRRYSWVCITGGEPLWQEDSLEELVRELKRESYKVTVETNGSLPLPRWYGLVDSWSADIKCPSSGVCGTSKEEWFSTRICDQIKFVVGDWDDLRFVKGVLKRHSTDSPVMLISPVMSWMNREEGLLEGTADYNQLWLQEVAEFCKEMGVRYSLQLQKIIWGNKKGV